MRDDPVADPIDGLGRARVALGCVFLLRTTPLLAPFHVPFLSDATPLLGWPDGHARFAPVVPVVPAALLAGLCIVRTLAAVAFSLGWRARAAGFVAGSLGYLTVLQDPARFYTTHHVIFLGTLLLASTDAVACCAIAPAPRRSPRSSRWLMRAWVASIYAWAAIAKLRPDWLDGRTLGLFARAGLFRPSVAGALLATQAGRAFVARGTVALELVLAALLLVRRSRRVALALAVAFHLGLEWAASPDLFGWAMIALLLVFVDPGEPSKRLSRKAPMLSRLFALVVVMTVGSACSKNALSAGDAATDVSTSSDLDSPGADVPPDAALTPPSGFTFPDAPQMSCGDARDCQFPPSACGRPSCEGGQCFDPGWIVYYDDPTCQGGQCVFAKRYFECGGGMGCAQGGCFSNVTIP